MRNILCFGDSNTYGHNPSGGRWPLHERWPGILQELLGEEYHIIEEGLCGRTTVFEDCLETDKSGRKHLSMLLSTHMPLDMVIIMLGTNDMKHRFSLLPADIANGAAELGHIVDTFDAFMGLPAPKVLLVSPVYIKEGIGHGIFGGFGEESVTVSKQLAPLFEERAKMYHWLYLDAAGVAEASERDKLHMEKEEHRKLAVALCSMIRAALPQKQG